MNSFSKLTLVPGHNIVHVITFIFFAAMTAGYSILGFSVEVITCSFEVGRSFKEICITFWLYPSAHWSETGYCLSTGQHAVLPEGKGKVIHLHRVRKKRCHFIFACNSAKC